MLDKVKDIKVDEIDEILDEYVKEDKPVKKPAKVLNNSSSPASFEESLLNKPAPSHKYGKFAITDVSRPNVSYINSVTEVRKNAADLPPKPTDAIEGYDGAIMTPQPSDDTYVPKVRKMSNSTRAKEMRARRRNRKKKNKKKFDFTYAVESPDGIYTKPEKKSKKFMIQREADEKPPAPINDNGDIIPLSEQNDPNALDIKITSIPMNEEKENDKKSKKREKNYSKKKIIKDYDSFEDARAIKRDILEVKDNISARMVILLILTVFSCYISMGKVIGLTVPEIFSSDKSPVAYCVFQLIFLGLSVAVSFSTFKNGIVSLFKFRSDSDSLSALAVLSSFMAALAAVIFSPDMVQNGKIFIYTPVAILSLLFNALGKKLILKRMASNFDYISKEKNINAIVCVENDDRAESFTRGTIGDFPVLATMKKTNFIKDFAKYTYSADTGDKYSRIIAPLIMIFSILLGVGVTLLRMDDLTMKSIGFAAFIFSAAVSACSCMAIPLIASIPLEKASKKYVRNHGVMLGYQSVEDFYDTNSVMVDAEAFFPNGTIDLYSVNLFSGTKIDDALLEAASLAAHGNSVLKELFTDIVYEKNETLMLVENFVYEDSMGLCGWIKNRRVLLGNRELLVNHKIEGIPTLTKEKEFTEGGKEALYLSVSGSLAAMFIIEVSASKAVLNCMKKLEKEEIAIIVKTVDPFITINRLSTLFHYSEDLIKIIPQRLVNDFDEETKKEKKISASMASSGRFSSFIQLIMGTKSIRKTVGIGIVIQLTAALLGFVLVAINSVLNAYSEITPIKIFGYQLLCTIITAIVVKARKI